jgi:hypothetical protein
VPNSGGCTGDHYSVAAGKLPPTDLLAGTIVFSGYAGGKFVDGTTAPSKISCARGQSGYYACGYGDLVNGAPGPLDPTRTPFGGNVMPITKDQNVAFSGSGGADVGAWNGMAAARDQVMLVSPANLSTVAYDATMDEKFTFTCPTEPMASCGFTAVVILIQASDQPPAMFGQPAQTFGVALCSGLALPGGLTFEKGALGAAFGCDKTGQNCDANLKSVQTTVIRIAVPTGVSDPMGHTINLAAGRGVAGVAPR